MKISFSDGPDGEVTWQETKDALFDNLLHELIQDMPEEEAMQMLEDFMERMEIETSRVYTLQQCLEFLRKEDLLDIARFNHFRGYSKAAPRPVNRLFLQQRLLQPDFVHQVITTSTLPEVTCLMQLCQGNLPIFSSDSYRNLATALNYGLCYTDLPERVFILPQELKPLVQKVLEDEDISYALFAEYRLYLLLYCCLSVRYLSCGKIAAACSGGLGDPSHDERVSEPGYEYGTEPTRIRAIRRLSGGQDFSAA